LNIGVGDGTFERTAQARGLIVYALDPSAGAIERLRAALTLGDRAKVGYSQSIPWPDETFDAVVMSEVLEHLDASVFQATLAEVRRVLRPDGRFLGTVPYQEDLIANQVICPDCGTQFHRWGHEQSFSLESLKGRLVEAGFAPLTIQSRAFPDFARKGSFNRLKSCARWLLGRMGQSIAQPSIYFLARPISVG
jgi:SAM-dependent methyltransferase